MMFFGFWMLQVITRCRFYYHSKMGYGEMGFAMGFRNAKGIFCRCQERNRERDSLCRKRVKSRSGLVTSCLVMVSISSFGLVG